MTCPVCGGKNRVLDSRSDCESVHRKRLCEECGHIFYTAEYDVDTDSEYKRILSENKKKGQTNESTTSV